MLFILFALSSCEKVIEIDLNNSKEALVIEATMSNNKLPFKVLVSKTTPYFGTKKSNPVSGAKVSARSEHGKVKYFAEISPGVYELPKVVALPGYWYIIDVEYNGVTYSARSFMNQTVPIAEVGLVYFNGYGVFDSGYKLNTYIVDPENTENYYRIKYFINGKANTDPGGTTVYSDQLFNGKDIGLTQRSTVFKETDTVTIELQSIDKAAYDYFSTLENISGNDFQQSAAPANPINNFNNGALGYFSAYTSDTKQVIIKDLIEQ
jgi:hypothetical protein